MDIEREFAETLIATMPDALVYSDRTGTIRFRNSPCPQYINADYLAARVVRNVGVNTLARCLNKNVRVGVHVGWKW
jgi:hypothetical protein